MNKSKRMATLKHRRKKKKLKERQKAIALATGVGVAEVKKAAQKPAKAVKPEAPPPEVKKPEVKKKAVKEVKAKAKAEKKAMTFKPKILVFACNWCSYAGADNAGINRMQYPPDIRVIRTMCSGRVNPAYIIDAFRMGADGVLWSGCHFGDCQGHL